MDQASEALTPEQNAVVAALASLSSGRPLLHRPEQAAAALGISRATVYELMASGEIESVQIGRSRRIPDTSLLDFVGRLRAEASA